MESRLMGNCIIRIDYSKSRQYKMTKKFNWPSQDTICLPRWHAKAIVRSKVKMYHNLKKKPLSTFQKPTTNEWVFLYVKTYQLHAWLPSWICQDLYH